MIIMRWRVWLTVSKLAATFRRVCVLKHGVQRNRPISEQIDGHIEYLASHHRRHTIAFISMSRPIGCKRTTANAQLTGLRILRRNMC